MILIYIIVSVFIVSLISFVGALALWLRPKFLDMILFGLVSFAAGALLAAAFLDLIPEAIEHGASAVSVWILLGVVVFYLIETFLYWYHCHYGHHHHHSHHHSIKPYAWLNIIGDGVHNFVDGTIIAAAYLVSIPLGLTTTLAVILHEIPQELGDFGVLVLGGLTSGKALFFNFVSALTAVIGALAVYYLSASVQNLAILLVPFAAGGFIYIASADLLPELHKERNIQRSIIQLLLFFSGIAVIWALTQFVPG